MNPVRASVSLCALALLGITASPAAAGDIKTTVVLRPGPSGTVSYYEYRPGGPIRRWLGLCPSKVVVVTSSPPVAVCLPAAPVCPPARGVVPPPAPIVPSMPPASEAPFGNSSYRPRPLPAPVPAPPLTPAQRPAPVRLDRSVSFPGIAR